jgi:3-oxoacid CoA-transferase subunit A
VADIPNGASIAIECWGYPATPQNLIAALKRKGSKDLTVITHTFIPMVWPEEDCALPSLLLPQMKKLITSIAGIMNLGAGAFLQEYVEKGLEIEIVGHGTLAARIQAGALGLGGICQSDLPCAMTHIIFQGLTGRPGSVCNPTFDFATDSALCSSCSG